MLKLNFLYNKFCFCSRGLTLNDLLAALEDEDDEPGTSNIGNSTNKEIDITLLPPVNSCEDNTDEDSGDEDFVSINNLPSSQLRAEAEITTFLDNDEDDDNIPLSIIQLGCKKSKTYHWANEDIKANEVQWPIFPTARNNLSPIEIFCNIFSTDMVDLFVKYTNLYAAKKNKTGDVTADEIRSFFAILLLSGYVPLPRRRMFWESTSDTHNELIARAMSRDRFEFIMSNLHCCDNDNLDKADKFAKVRPFFVAINKIFLEFAVPTENHSIDECMVPYFGKHGLKQCILNKPVRFGYKVWMGTTSNGYVNWVEPYQGSKSVIKNAYKDFGLGPSVVLEYADVIQSLGIYPYHLFFDNFFTNIPLLEALSQKRIRATGTIRENRCGNCPLSSKAVVKKKERGFYEYQSIKEKNIVVARWHDNNVVGIASNAIPVTPVQNVSRYSRKEKKTVYVKQPLNIHKYNKNMGGVDRCDQNISLYRTKIRGKKWYFCLIAFGLDLIEHNCWQLHKLQGGKLDHLTFRRRIATAFLERAESRKRGRPSSLENIDSRFDRMDHLVGQQEKQTRCRLCHNKVKTICLKCKVALHIGCFAPYHKN